MQSFPLKCTFPPTPPPNKKIKVVLLLDYQTSKICDRNAFGGQKEILSVGTQHVVVGDYYFLTLAQPPSDNDNRSAALLICLKVFDNFDQCKVTLSCTGWNDIVRTN